MVEVVEQTEYQQRIQLTETYFRSNQIFSNVLLSEYWVSMPLYLGSQVNQSLKQLTKTVPSKLLILKQMQQKSTTFTRASLRHSQ